MGVDRGCVLQAACDAVGDDCVHVRMQSEWGCDEPFDGGVFPRSLSYERGNIFRPVATGRQEIGKHNDSLRTALHAAIEGGGD